MKIETVLSSQVPSLPSPGSVGDVEAVTELAHQLHRAVKGLRFGTVEIVVHEGRIVQVERREKYRLGHLGFQTI